MAKEYTDKATIENYINKDIDEALDAQLTEYIQAMTLEADRIANRSLVAAEVSESEDPETRIYDGDGSSIIIVDDCTDVTAVKVNDVEVPYTEYPRNKGYTSRIVLENGLRFSRGYGNVEVTAKFGLFAEVPENIKFAVTVMVAGILNGMPAEGEDDETISSEKIGNYQVSYSTPKAQDDSRLAMSILKGYRRIAI